MLSGGSALIGWCKYTWSIIGDVAQRPAPEMPGVTAAIVQWKSVLMAIGKPQAFTA